MTSMADRLWAFLPEIHRIRDAEAGGPLRDFVEVLARGAEVVAQELDDRYDDLFIETAADWATDYVGQLVGYHRLDGASASAVSPRAQIADTIALRRRKGTASMLERLAVETAGWPAAVVEDFERIAATQFLNHVRPAAAATAAVGGAPAIEPSDGAFGRGAHTVDVRRIDAPSPSRPGRFNLPDVAVFLWRTSAVRIGRASAVPAGGDGRFRFDQLGMDTPLYVAPSTDRDPDARTGPLDVPRPLGRWRLRDLRNDLVGTARSVAIERRTATQTRWQVEEVARIHSSDLSDDGATWANKPPPGFVAVDPLLGRLWFGTPPAATTAIAVTFHFGIAVPIGARAAQAPAIDPAAPRLRDGADPAAALALAGTGAGGTLVFADNLRYGPAASIHADAGATVVVCADDRVRPVLDAPQGVRLDLGAGATLVIRGIVLTGGPLILAERGDLAVRTVVLEDCTVVPGRRRTPSGEPTAPGAASVIVLDPFAIVRLERCVTGPIVAVEGAEVVVTDSIVDAGDPERIAFAGRAATTGGGGAPQLRTVPPAPDDITTPAYEAGEGAVAGGRLRLCASTIVGGVHATSLDATDAILLAELGAGAPAIRRAAILATERQQDCVRHSWLPYGSRVGHRYRCLPASAATPAVPPRLTSLRFGHPGYGRLEEISNDAIRSLASDGGEPGASHLLHAPERERHLRIRLDEYLRFGMAAGLCYADDMPPRGVQEGGPPWLPM